MAGQSGLRWRAPHSPTSPASAAATSGATVRRQACPGCARASRRSARKRFVRDGDRGFDESAARGRFEQRLRRAGGCAAAAPARDGRAGSSRGSAAASDRLASARASAAPHPLARRCDRRGRQNRRRCRRRGCAAGSGARSPPQRRDWPRARSAAATPFPGCRCRHRPAPPHASARCGSSRRRGALSSAPAPRRTARRGRRATRPPAGARPRLRRTGGADFGNGARVVDEDLFGRGSTPASAAAKRRGRVETHRRFETRRGRRCRSKLPQAFASATSVSIGADCSTRSPNSVCPGRPSPRPSPCKRGEGAPARGRVRRRFRWHCSTVLATLG